MRHVDLLAQQAKTPFPRTYSIHRRRAHYRKSPETRALVRRALRAYLRTHLADDRFSARSLVQYYGGKLHPLPGPY